MSTHPEGTPHSYQDTIANLHLRLNHAELQRDAAQAMLRTEMKEIMAETFVYIGGQLGLVGGKHENKRHEFVRSSDHIKEVLRLKAEIEQLQARCDFLEGRNKE